jgi:hypothetical protein
MYVYTTKNNKKSHCTDERRDDEHCDVVKREPGARDVFIDLLDRHPIGHGVLALLLAGPVRKKINTRQ